MNLKDFHIKEGGVAEHTHLLRDCHGPMADQRSFPQNLYCQAVLKHWNELCSDQILFKIPICSSVFLEVSQGIKQYLNMCSTGFNWILKASLIGMLIQWHPIARCPNQSTHGCSNHKNAWPFSSWLAPVLTFPEFPQRALMVGHLLLQSTAN